MNETRRSFLGSIGALLSGVPFIGTGRKKVKETFAVKIEEIDANRWRATLKTSGFLGCKIAVIDSPDLSSMRYPDAHTRTARLFLMFEIQRAMKVHVFPEDKDAWNNPMSSAFVRVSNETNSLMAVQGANAGEVEFYTYDEESIIKRLEKKQSKKS